MMAPSGSPKSNTQAERLVRIETQLTVLCERQDELLKTVKEISVKVNARDIFCAAQGVNYTNHTQKLDDHEARLDAIEKLMPALKAALWVGTILGGSVIVFIWTIIIGQVQVVFP